MVKKKEHKDSTMSEEAKESTQRASASQKKKFNFSKLNYWMVATVVLAVVLLVMVSFNAFTTISSKQAGAKAIELASMSGLVLNVTGVDDLGNFYGVNYSIQGQEGVLHITKDGKYIGQLSEFPKKSSSTNTQTETSATVPKTNKPVVELFIWSYCPYGVQAQGPMAQVASLLGNSADFKIVQYYDGHGAYETQQNKIQSCIQKLYSDKYWSYAAKFVSDVYPKCSSARTEDCDKTESVKIMKALGIDSTKVMSCVSSDGASLLASASSNAQQKGVTGSPSIVINGVMVNVAINAEAMKAAVCGAFDNAPSACSSTLDSTAAAAAGNC